MLFFANSIILLILDSFLLLLCFSVFVCVWMVFMFFIFINNTIRIRNNFVFLDFISSKYLDLYWFLLGSFFISALLLRLSLLLYYSWLSLLVFDLCRVVAFQWYWIFFLFKDSVIFSNLLVESDYFVGDLRLLQCNNNFTLLSLVVYKLWLTSIDVIHSFTISSLGVKVDCIPGRCTELALVSNLQGTFYGQCSELCGVLHGFMPIVITFI